MNRLIISFATDNYAHIREKHKIATHIRELRKEIDGNRSPESGGIFFKFLLCWERTGAFLETGKMHQNEVKSTE